MSEPAMPTRVVMTKPMCSVPGAIQRAIRPTTKPTMIDQMMWNMHFPFA